jgi:hypothetical protein
MATCPKCGRFLTDGHRCHGGWRRAGRYAAVAAVGALIGCVGTLVGFDNPPDSLTAVVTLLGAVLAPALWRSLR